MDKKLELEDDMRTLTKDLEWACAKSARLKKIIHVQEQAADMQGEIIHCHYTSGYTDDEVCDELFEILYHDHSAELQEARRALSATSSPFVFVSDYTDTSTDMDMYLFPPPPPLVYLGPEDAYSKLLAKKLELEDDKHTLTKDLEWKRANIECLERVIDLQEHAITIRNMIIDRHYASEHRVDKTCDELFRILRTEIIDIELTEAWNALWAPPPPPPSHLVSLYDHTGAKVTFKMVMIKGDGNCLFRAIGDQLYGMQEWYADLRKEICDYMENNPTIFQDFFVRNEDEPLGAPMQMHIQQMRENKTWGGYHELTAAARLYNVSIEVHYRDQEVQPILFYDEQAPFRTRTLHLFAEARTGVHYHSLHPDFGETLRSYERSHRTCSRSGLHHVFPRTTRILRRSHAKHVRMHQSS